MGDLRTAETLEFNYNQINILCLEKLTIFDTEADISYDIIQESVMNSQIMLYVTYLPANIYRTIFDTNNRIIPAMLSIRPRQIQDGLIQVEGKLLILRPTVTKTHEKHQK